MAKTCLTTTDKDYETIEKNAITFFLQIKRSEVHMAQRNAKIEIVDWLHYYTTGNTVRGNRYKIL